MIFSVTFLGDGTVMKTVASSIKSLDLDPRPALWAASGPSLGSLVPLLKDSNDSFYFTQLL